MEPPRTGGPPVEVIIGAGATADEARKLAAELGHGRAVRTSAEVHEAAPALIDLPQHLLPVSGGVVDMNRTLVDMREGTEPGVKPQPALTLSSDTCPTVPWT